ncbi:hypothetical protein HELRODRAFT_163281 [Helobdella robusta]|uniref:EF-hand domain-containing protein n=1 Tax=Helobdella robusta TaxID=6412 RepID=T1ETV3_HELRO|nr:hypothetical protein HELRODRAFT_163281 [Helobdella robusta]ESN96237.1 hypothetical protein HELRODRAFT_163281 [Helobdella robusta]
MGEMTGQNVKQCGDSSDVLEANLENLNDVLHETFHKFSNRRNVISLTELKHWCTDAAVIGKHMNQTHIDVSFYKIKKKGTNVVTFKDFLLLLDLLTVKYVDDTWLDKKHALAHLKFKLSVAVPVFKNIPPPDVTIGAVDRLTDAKLFTGTFKHVFSDMGAERGKKRPQRYNLL